MKTIGLVPWYTPLSNDKSAGVATAAPVSPTPAPTPKPTPRPTPKPTSGTSCICDLSLHWHGACAKIVYASRTFEGTGPPQASQKGSCPQLL